MSPKEYNEALAQIGAAAGLVVSIDLDAVTLQFADLETLIRNTDLDDDGNPIDKAEMVEMLSGIRQMVEAAKTFVSMLPYSIRETGHV